MGLAAGGHSGVPRYTAALTAALDRVADEFPGLSMCLMTTPRGAEQSRPRRIAVDVVRGASAGPRRIVKEQGLARRARADLLHFFDLTGPLLAPRRTFVTTVHDAALRHGFENVRLLHKRVLQPWALRHATAAVAVSAFAKDEAVQLFSARAEKLDVIHSGPGLVSDHDVAAPRRGDPYVLYVGNLAAHKNLPFLIRAFESVGGEGRLVLVGGRGERFEEVCRAVEASPAAGRIEIRRDASDSEVDGLYRGASMLVLPSRYEGFGFTALEAMSRGCPVLESDIPALREVSGDGAWLLPVDDRAAWTDAMHRVLADGDLRRDLVRRGEDTVRRYSWDETARAVCRLFLRVGHSG